MYNFIFTLHFSDDSMIGVDSVNFETLDSLRKFYHELYRTRKNRLSFRFYLSISHSVFGLLVESKTHYFNNYSNLRFNEFSKLINKRAVTMYVNKYLKFN